MQIEKTFISSGAFRSSSLAEMIKICDVLNFHNIELSSGLKWAKDLIAEIGYYEKHCKFLIHNYFPPPKEPFVLNLAARDTAVLQMSREHCKRAIQLCAQHGVPFYSVHSGFAFEVDPSRLGQNLSDAPRYPIQIAKKIFVESIQLLCEYSESLNIKIAIENNVLAQMNLIDGKNQLLLGVTPEELLEIQQLVRKNNFGFLIDVGHIKVSANSLHLDLNSFISQLKEHIIAFHLNDNDGIVDSNQMFDEKSWFMAEIKHFPNHYKVIESYQLTAEQLKQQITLVQTI